MIRSGENYVIAARARSPSLACRQRSTHSQYVDFATLQQAAACCNVNPSSSTSSTIRSRTYLTAFATSLGTSARENAVSCGWIEGQQQPVDPKRALGVVAEIGPKSWTLSLGIFR